MADSEDEASDSETEAANALRAKSRWGPSADMTTDVGCGWLVRSVHGAIVWMTYCGMPRVPGI